MLNIFLKNQRFQKNYQSLEILKELKNLNNNINSLKCDISALRSEIKVLWFEFDVLNTSQQRYHRKVSNFETSEGDKL